MDSIFTILPLKMSSLTQPGTISGYEWVACCNFNMPLQAVKGGSDLDGSDVYMGLALHNGDELPCKVVPSRREAYVSSDGKEIPVKVFKVLRQKTLRWVCSHNGQVPPGAIPAGKTTCGETLYIGKTMMQNATVVGKIHPSHGCLYVPFDGKEVCHKAYEVLVCN